MKILNKSMQQRKSNKIGISVVLERGNKKTIQIRIPRSVGTMVRKGGKTVGYASRRYCAT
jgi:hypothetical protein